MLSFQGTNETNNSGVSLGKLGKAKRGSMDSKQPAPFIPELTHNNLEKFMKM